MPTSESVPRETSDEESTTNDIYEIACQIYPFMISLTQRHGGLKVMAALATVISNMADKQKNPDAALEQFISLLLDAHRIGKSVPRETVGD